MALEGVMGVASWEWHHGIGVIGVASWEWRLGSGVMGVASWETMTVSTAALEEIPICGVLSASLGFGGVPVVLAALRKCWRRR